MTTPLPRDTDGMRYSVCGPADIPAVVRALAETFTRSDPPAVAVGLTPEEFGAFVDLIVRPDTTQSLTIVARDLATGDLAGAMLSVDAATPLPDAMSQLSPGFDAIFDLFGRLDEQIEQPVSHPGDVLHLFLLGVDGRFSGRGIAQRLVQESLEHGIAKGYRTARVEATNLTSQHIFRRFGFSVLARTSYADYRRDGVAVFASIADQGGPMAMVRDLR